jgi:uncharacterized protein YndB with AHSA1/START domain
MTTSISVSRTISAPPDQVWALIADLPRMGEWSPENTGGTWIRGATGPEVGARFTGTNANGKRRWKTSVKVTTCDPGRAFAFDVTVGLAKVANWAYDLEPADGGCTVTETWTDQRGWLAKALGGPVSGVKERADHNRAGMEATLAALATVAGA